PAAPGDARPADHPYLLGARARRRPPRNPELDLALLTTRRRAPCEASAVAARASGSFRNPEPGSARMVAGADGPTVGERQATSRPRRRRRHGHQYGFFSSPVEFGRPGAAERLQ